MNHTAHTLRQLAARGALDLPRPGAGLTSERHQRLVELARRHPVSVGRLAEAHTDAVAIRAEAGEATVGHVLYGVWASEMPDAQVTIDASGATLTGVKPFCSGLGIVDRALMTAKDHEGRTWLVDIDTTEGATLRHTTDGWATHALADTSTGTVTLDAHVLEPHALIGAHGWYLDRVGFWHGACGPAAAWAGAAIGLVDHAAAHTGDDRHRLEALGAMRVTAWALRSLLAHAAAEIDAQPHDHVAARPRALALRQVVERQCTELLDRFSQVFGPRPFTTDAAVAQRYADTHLYLRQHHGSRDLHELGTTAHPFEEAAARPNPQTLTS
jgi:hypothetical protein